MRRIRRVAGVTMTFDSDAWTVNPLGWMVAGMVAATVLRVWFPPDPINWGTLFLALVAVQSWLVSSMRPHCGFDRVTLFSTGLCGMFAVIQVVDWLLGVKG